MRENFYFFALASLGIFPVALLGFAGVGQLRKGKSGRSLQVFMKIPRIPPASPLPWRGNRKINRVVG